MVVKGELPFFLVVLLELGRAEGNTRGGVDGSDT
jgi:hypothetical protein